MKCDLCGKPIDFDHSVPHEGDEETRLCQDCYHAVNAVDAPKKAEPDVRHRPEPEETTSQETASDKTSTLWRPIVMAIGAALFLTLVPHSFKGMVGVGMMLVFFFAYFNSRRRRESEVEDTTDNSPTNGDLAESIKMPHRKGDRYGDGEKGPPLTLAERENTCQECGAACEASQIVCPHCARFCHSVPSLPAPSGSTAKPSSMTHGIVERIFMVLMTIVGVVALLVVAAFVVCMMAVNH